GSSSLKAENRIGLALIEQFVLSDIRLNAEVMVDTFRAGQVDEMNALVGNDRNLSIDGNGEADHSLENRRQSQFSPHEYRILAISPAFVFFVPLWRRSYEGELRLRSLRLSCRS